MNQVQYDTQLSYLARMAFSAYNSTRRRSLCCSIVGDAGYAAAAMLQALPLLPLGLDGTSLLLAAAACLPTLLVVLLLFLAGLLLELRCCQLSRLLRSVSDLNDWLLRAVGLLGSLLLSV
jgi:hypothetical protein